MPVESVSSATFIFPKGFDPISRVAAASLGCILNATADVVGFITQNQGPRLRLLAYPHTGGEDKERHFWHYMMNLPEANGLERTKAAIIALEAGFISLSQAPFLVHLLKHDEVIALNDAGAPIPKTLAEMTAGQVDLWVAHSVGPHASLIEYRDEHQDFVTVK